MRKALDDEWVLLILEAIKLGISAKEIRDFLKDRPRT
ncbi:anti-repressor SinI family protein [Bacillus sp. FSL K6-3431]